MTETKQRRVLVLSLAILLLGVAPAAAAPPDEFLPTPARGARALEQVQDKLPQVAAANRMTPERLAQILAGDLTSGLDRNGRLFFVEDAQKGAEPDSGSFAAETSLVTADAFALHSLPGSPRTIYLDFDGMVLTDTVWNDQHAGDPSVTLPPYNLDGDPATFNAAERADIVNVWQRVAEDYVPFNVDVTTEEPPVEALIRSDQDDQVFGTRVLITRDVMGICSCGGWAYLNVFDDIPNTPLYRQPALVFYESLRGGAKSVAEAASHEAGHNLGLEHDGTSGATYYRGHGSGATGWAPIMGAAYDRELSQWSKGEYPNANKKEDDLAIIASHGAPVRTDDFPGSPAGAPLLGGTDTGSQIMVEQQGLIETRTDTDWFSFTTTGIVDLSVQPASVGPNLDVEAALYTPEGALAALSGNPSNDPSFLGAAFSTVLPAGQYYLRVDGVGDTSPLPGYTDYASLGAYSVTGTISTGPLSVPGPPTNVTATAGNGSATVSFDPPAFDGGSPVTGYLVTSSPGGLTATAPAGPVTVSGLTNGTAYSFTVRAANGTGYGLPSAPSNQVIPAGASAAFSIGDVSVTEGNTGTKTGRLTVTRTGNLNQISTLMYATGGGTATAGTDYVGVASTLLRFGRGIASKQIPVTIRGDRTVEPNETFSVQLSAPTNASISRGAGTVTIVDND